MPLLVNLRHLEAHEVLLEGELPVAELDIETLDEVVRLGEPLKYNLAAQKLDGGLLLQGRLQLDLQCECVRCLKTFRLPLILEGWARHLALQGEEAVVINNDCVDLTPYVREDILLEFPQHPLCDPECGGLPKTQIGKAKHTSYTGQPAVGSPAWNALNKLKF